MPFPDKKKLQEIREKLSNKEGSLSLPTNASPLEKLRWDICQKFIKFKRTNNLTQKKLAKMIETDESKVSKILHHRIEEFSTDRLLSFYQAIDPSIDIKVS